MSDSTLTHVIRDGDLAAVQKAIASKRYNLNAVDEDGYTPLYLACMKEATAPAVPYLIAAGAYVDQKGSDKETPLFIACFNGLREAADRLLKAGANANETNGNAKETALHAAARLGYDEIVGLLLDAGANINFRNGNLETPLYEAAKSNRLQVTYRLLEAGANKTLQNSDSKDPLYIASERGHKGMVELLKAEKKELKHTLSNALYDERNKAPPLRPSSAYDGEKPASEHQKEVQPTQPPAAALAPPAKKPEPPAKVDAAKRAASPAKKLAERAATSPPPQRELESGFQPTTVVPIDIPKPETRSHDPLTGKKYAPCKTLFEAGAWEQPPPPKDAVKDFPELRASYGGTSMVVGAGEDTIAVRQPVFDPEKGDVFDNVILPKERRASHTG